MTRSATSTPHQPTAQLSAQPAKRATIEDVARQAEVSVATVSRAMRGLPNVAPSTRRRVQDVAESCGYTADPAASRLAAGQTRTVTVVIPNLSGWYFSTVVAGVEAVCSDAGYDVLVLGVGSQNDLSRLLSESYHLEKRTDGLVVVDVAMQPEEAASISARGVAIATVGNSMLDHPSVRIDDEAVGHLAATHLLDLGHRRLAMIGGMIDDPMNFPVPKLRRNGFVAALSERDLSFDDSLLEGGDFGIDGGHEAMLVLLDRHDPPTAVFAMSDEMAFGALMAMRSRSVEPGRDVSLIGVDDHEFARVVDLTTIRQSVAEHGANAARLLLDVMSDTLPGDLPAADDRHIVSTVFAPVELVVRSTTAKPSQRRR